MLVSYYDLHVYNSGEMLIVKNSNCENYLPSAETFNFSTKLSTYVENLELRSEKLLKISLLNSRFST